MRYAHALVCAAAIAAAAPAQAAPVITAINANLATKAYTFTFMGDAFTFSASGDFFSPLAVQDGAGAATNSYGGFLGIPVQPTSDFVDRGVVTFGPTDPYATFATKTTVPYSNGNNFIGLRATVGSQNYFGFAYTTNAVLNSIGFETVAGQAITATTAVPIAAVPEAASWAMMIAGVALTGGALRRRRARPTVRVAYA